MKMKNEYDFSKGVRGKYVAKIMHHFLRPIPRWKNPSVRLLAGDNDPFEVVRDKARAIVLQAIDRQQLSIPIDPFKLAELQSIAVIPRPDIREARTVPGPNNKPVIEYNPDRPKARIRFSICHEIGHTLFPDCIEQVRHRGFHSNYSAVSQELEVLCNLAAAEFLLPIGSIDADVRKLNLSIDTAIDLRQKYEASVEAVLLRILGLSAAAECAVFAALPDYVEESGQHRYRLEYVKTTPNWTPRLKRGDFLPIDTAARECTAIGVTAKSEEEWVPGGGKMRVEMVATTPYLDTTADPQKKKTFPRIVGLIKPTDSPEIPKPPFEILRGNALEPRGIGQKIVAHIVNDKTANWGAGFGRALQQKWPKAQQQFKSVFENARGSRLGITYLSHVAGDIYTFQMVCQRGFGPSPYPRLRYEALRQCLEQLRNAASTRNASVHMPKIGTGEAGGSWGLISNLIAEELCSNGVKVTIYETNQKGHRQKQEGLFDQASI